MAPQWSAGRRQGAGEAPFGGFGETRRASGETREPLAQGPGASRRSTADKPAQSAQTWLRGARCCARAPCSIIATSLDDALCEQGGLNISALECAGISFFLSVAKCVAAATASESLPYRRCAPSYFCTWINLPICSRSSGLSLWPCTATACWVAVDQFFLAVGGNRNRAVHIARVLTAIDEHPRHESPPDEAARYGRSPRTRFAGQQVASVRVYFSNAPGL